MAQLNITLNQDKILQLLLVEGYLQKNSYEALLTSDVQAKLLIIAKEQATMPAA